MQLRTALSIGILAGAFVAVPAYFITRADRTDESTADREVAAVPQNLDLDAEKLYCTQRTASNGVLVDTGPDCSHRGQAVGAPATTVTITREQGALVITGSDP
jgi:hypothetical protein